MKHKNLDLDFLDGISPEIKEKAVEAMMGSNEISISSITRLLSSFQEGFLDAIIKTLESLGLTVKE